MEGNEKGYESQISQSTSLRSSSAPKTSPTTTMRDQGVDLTMNMQGRKPKLQGHRGIKECLADVATLERAFRSTHYEAAARISGLDSLMGAGEHKW